MKKLIIAISPFVLLMWLVIGLDKGFVIATIEIVVFAITVALAICWLTFVEKHFNDD